MINLCIFAHRKRQREARQTLPPNTEGASFESRSRRCECVSVRRISKDYERSGHTETLFFARQNDPHQRNCHAMSHKHYEEEPIVPPHEKGRCEDYTKRLQQAHEALAQAIAATRSKETETSARKTALQQAIDANRFEEEWNDETPWCYVPPDDEPPRPAADAFASLPFTTMNHNDMPDALRQYYHTRPLYTEADAAKHFYEAALALAHVEDSSEIVPYNALRPTLQNMTIAQLRSYFTFRTQWRKGVHLKVSSGYIYLLFYETLMLIGMKDAEEGWQQLQDLDDTYACDLGRGRMRKTMEQWRKDFVAYYNLHHHTEEAFLDTMMHDLKVERLLMAKEKGYQKLWPVLSNLCSHRMARCETIVNDSKLVQQVVCNVLHNIDRKYLPAGNDIISQFTGAPLCECYPMFANALFYDPKKPRNYSFEVNAARRYVCDEGQWRLEYYRLDTAFSPVLSDILHETDRLLREHVKSKNTIKARPTAPALLEIIRQSIDKTLQHIATARATAARKASMKAVHIDMSKLQSIRHDAESVCQQLTVEEETPENLNADTAPSAPCAETKAENTPSNGTNLLNATEQEYLQLLLSGSNPVPFLQTHRQPASVWIETINEKLYDTIGDIAIDDSDGTPRIVEDYREELITLLH